MLAGYIHFDRQPLSGPWDRGIALDHHRVAHKGEASRYTSIAEALRRARSEPAAFDAVVDAMARHLAPRFVRRLREWDLAVPVPPSGRLGPARQGDFVHDIAVAACGKAGIPLVPCVATTRVARSLVEARDAAHRDSLRDGLYRLVDPDAVAGKRVLVVDDTCFTGATLRAFVAAIRGGGSPRDVGVLTVTTAGGVDRSMTLEEKAREELREMFGDCEPGFGGGDPYVGDGMYLAGDGRLVDRS